MKTPVRNSRKLYQSVFIGNFDHSLAQLPGSHDNTIDSAITWLQILAFSWCMRSCEYSNVQGERHTKILCVRNIRFFDDLNKGISSNVELLTTASTVSITFEIQKKDVRNNAISHQCSFDDSLNGGDMCPVCAAAEIAKRIYSYDIPEDKIKDTPINFIQLDSKDFMIPSKIIISPIVLRIFI